MIYRKFLISLIAFGLFVIFQLRATENHLRSDAMLSSIEGNEASVYEVGPDKMFTSIHQVPWGSLMPGDKVLIYWRDEPYKEKFALSRMGTKEAPITVSGVPGPDGQLPVLDGNGATIVSNYSFANDNRCVIKVGSARFNGSQPIGKVGYLIIENLKIKSAHGRYTYFDRGTEKQYSSNASSIYVEYADNIIIRNNILTDCANGLFTANGSKNVLIEGNYLFDNGVPNSIREHSVYMSGDGLIFQYNYFGPMKQESPTIGNNIKMRGSGEVFRYNFIEGGNRAFDLTDDAIFVDNPAYHETHIYGNIIIDTGQGTNPNIIHYGGDTNNPGIYRRGTLYFYNNTVIHQRQQSANQYIFQVDNNDQKIEAWNNIFYFTSRNAYLKSGGSQNGVFRLKNNWIVSHWRIGTDPNESAKTDIVVENSVEGESPLFVDMTNMDYRLLPESPCINAGTEIISTVLPTHSLDNQYVVHLAGETRPMDDAIDIGAFEYVNDGTGLIRHFNQEPDFFIYPNPATDLINLKLGKEDNKNYSYQLLDSNGKVLMSGNIDNLEANINVGNLSPAIYFVRIFESSTAVKNPISQESRQSGISTEIQYLKHTKTVRVTKL